MKNLKTIVIWALLFVSAPAFSATSWLPVYGNKGDRTPKSVSEIQNLYTNWIRMNCTKAQYQAELASIINEEITSRNWPKGPNALTADNIDYVFTMLKEGPEVDAEVLTAAVDNTGTFHSVKRSKYVSGEKWMVIIPSEAFGYAGVTDNQPIKVCLNTCMNPKNRQKATNWIDDEQPLDQGGMTNRPGVQTQNQGGMQQQQQCCGNTYVFVGSQQEQVRDPQFWVPAQQYYAQPQMYQQPMQTYIVDPNRGNGLQVANLIVSSLDLVVDVYDAFGHRTQVPNPMYGYANGGNITINNSNYNSNTNSNSQYQSGIIKYLNGGTTTTGGGGVNPTNGGGGVPVNSTNGRMMNTGFGGSIAGTTSIGPGGQVIKW